MGEAVVVALRQSQGADSRYAKLVIRDGDNETTIELSHQQIGELIGGLEIPAVARQRPCPRFM